MSNILSGGLDVVSGISRLWPELEENALFLQTKIGVLEDKKVDIHERLQNEERRPGKKRKREVEGWRNNVEKIINEFGNWVQVRQSTGFYHVFKRHKLARQLERMTKVVMELVSQSYFPEGLFLEEDESIGLPSLNDQAVCLRLSKQEASYLFFKTLGLGRDELPAEEVKVICDEMVNRCNGLPLALITLARSMRRTLALSLRCKFDLHEWSDILEGLKSCLRLANGEDEAHREDEVLLILFYSYRQLRDTILQRCFLHCSSYPEDFRVSRKELIEKFISEKLMEQRLSREAEFNQGLKMLKQLENACLLKIDSDGYLKMHNLIRQMATRITEYSKKLGFDIQ